MWKHCYNKLVQVPRNREFIEFGGKYISLSESCRHFFVIGEGFGPSKHIIINDLIYQVSNLVKLKLLNGLLINYSYRESRENYFGQTVYNFNPKEARNNWKGELTAWDVNKDIITSEDSEWLAQQLISKDYKFAKIFHNLEVGVLSDIINFFIKHSPESWSLRDILQVFQNEQTFNIFIERIPSLNNRLGASQSFKEDIFCGIRASMYVLKRVVTHWEGSDHMISLSYWLKNGGIITICSNFGCDSPLHSILDQVIWKAALRAILRQNPKSAKRNFVIVQDIFPTNTDEIFSFICQARQYNTSVISGLEDTITDWQEELKTQAEGIIGNSYYKGILGARDKVFAYWIASELMYNDEYTKEILKMVEDSKLVKERGIHGIYLDRNFRRYVYTQKKIQALNDYNESRNFTTRVKPSTKDNLTPWGESDRARLNIPWLPIGEN